MTDITAPQRKRLIKFVNQDLMNNANGIGNECTHLIYAALFEAKALDGVVDRPTAGSGLVMGQGGVPYTWGRKLGAVSQGQAGDIVQYHGFKNELKFDRITSTGTNSLTLSFIRGPNHTAVLWGVGSRYIMEAESHLTHPRLPTMKTRLGLVFTSNFSVFVTEQEYTGNDIVRDFIDGIPWNSSDQIGEYLATKGMFSEPYQTLFSSYVPSSAEEHKFDTEFSKYRTALQQGKSAPRASVRGSDVRFAMRHTRTSGANALNVFVPQDSAKRRGLSGTALADEKSAVVAAMKRGGRAGTSAHGDSKTDRSAAGFFDWTSLP